MTHPRPDDPSPVPDRPPALPAGDRVGTTHGREVWWPWRWSLVGFVVVIPIGLLGTVTGPEQDAALGVANSMWLLFMMVVIGGGLALLAQYRLSGQVEFAWLAAVLLVGGVYLVVHVVPLHLLTRPAGGLAVADLLACAGLVMIRAASRRVTPHRWRHPLVLLPLLSVLLVLTRHRTIPLPAGDPTVGTSLGGIIVLAFCLLTVVWVRRMTTFPRSIRRAIATSVVVTTMVTRLPWWAVPESSRVYLTILLLGATTMLLMTSLLAILRWGITRYQRAVVGLADRANRAETTALNSEQVIEDLRTSLAGIARANDLLRSPDAHLSEEHQHVLRSSVTSEMHRLERLLARPIGREDGPYDLDRALMAAAEGQRTAGRAVRVVSSGLVVRGAPEQLSETVRELIAAVVARDPAARIHLVPERTATEVHVNLRIASRVIAGYPHRPMDEASPGSGEGSASAEWDRLDLDHVTLLALRHRMRLRGEDLHWGRSPDGADITLVVRR